MKNIEDHTLEYNQLKSYYDILEIRLSTLESIVNTLEKEVLDLQSLR